MHVFEHPMLAAANAAVDAAAEIILERDRNVEQGHVVFKGEADPVTEFDRRAEQAVRTTLARMTADVPVYGEEFGAEGDPGTGTWWVCDPIDGTVNFTVGSEDCATMLCLTCDGHPELAVINFPFRHERYVAVTGQGVTCNGNLCVIPPAGAPEHMILVAPDSLRFFPGAEGQLRAAVTWALQHAYRVRMPGAACAELRLLLSGQAHAHISAGFSRHDTLPFLLLAAEAGAVSLTLDGGQYTAPNGSARVIGTPETVNMMLAHIRS